MALVRLPTDPDRSAPSSATVVGSTGAAVVVVVGASVVVVVASLVEVVASEVVTAADVLVVAVPAPELTPSPLPPPEHAPSTSAARRVDEARARRREGIGAVWQNGCSRSQARGRREAVLPAGSAEVRWAAASR